MAYRLYVWFPAAGEWAWFGSSDDLDCIRREVSRWNRMGYAAEWMGW